MPDVTICPGTGCDKKKKCYRYMAKPDEDWQAVFVKAPVETIDGLQFCAYFWEIEKQ